MGRVGNSGTEAYHLHYTQLADGNAVQIAFNGTLINTHAGNLASYDTWGDGEKLTSANCPMNSFVNVDQDGTRYQLLYKPGTGAAKIVALDSDGTGITSIWSSTWTKGWTHFTPFRIGGDRSTRARERVAFSRCRTRQAAAALFHAMNVRERRSR